MLVLLIQQRPSSYVLRELLCVVKSMSTALVLTNFGVFVQKHNPRAMQRGDSGLAN